MTQMAPDNPFIQFGLEGWREFWAQETYILRSHGSRALCPKRICSPDWASGVG